MLEDNHIIMKKMLDVKSLRKHMSYDICTCLYEVFGLAILSCLSNFVELIGGAQH